MTETRHTFCRICESLCGLEVDVEGGRVVAARPDPQHVATGGFACPKGLKQHLMYGSPDRLEHPLKQTQDGLQVKTTWVDALSGYPSYFNVIAVEDGTKVDWTPKINTLAGSGVPAVNGGQTGCCGSLTRCRTGCSWIAGVII